jgi:hypothetical protein
MQMRVIKITAVIIGCSPGHTDHAHSFGRPLAQVLQHARTVFSQRVREGDASLQGPVEV